MTWGHFNPCVGLPSTLEDGKELVYLGDVNTIYHDDEDAFHAMKDEAEDAEYADAEEVCSHLRAWAEARGYVVNPREEGLRLEKDYHVRYERSRYQGRKCFILTWSGYEYVWAEPQRR